MNAPQQTWLLRAIWNFAQQPRYLSEDAFCQAVANHYAVVEQYAPEIKASVELVNAIGGNQSNAEVQYLIAGPNLTKLADYSEKLQAEIGNIPDLVDVNLLRVEEETALEARLLASP